MTPHIVKSEKVFRLKLYSEWSFSGLLTDVFFLRGGEGVGGGVGGKKKKRKEKKKGKVGERVK